MSEYQIKWSAFGIATVQANSLEEAASMVSEGLFGWSGDIDWERTTIDGVDIHGED